MSLIEEALKKQQKDLNAKRTPAVPSSPMPSVNEQPPPVPPSVATTQAGAPPEADPSSKKKMVQVVIIIVILLIAILVILYNSGILFNPTPPPVPVKQTITVSPPKPPLPPVISNVPPRAVAPTVMTVAPPADSPGEGAEISGTPAVGPIHTPLTKPLATTPVTPPEAVRNAGETAPAAKPIPITLLQPVKEPVIWPELKLTAVMDTSGGHGTAIINNSLVSEGQSVDGVDIISISTRHGIKVSYQGEVRILKK